MAEIVVPSAAPQARARVVVVGNEKGGAGKSTIAIHLATALLHAGWKVCALDLDMRQQSMSRFFSNRQAWAQANGADLPNPLANALDGRGVEIERGGPDLVATSFQSALVQAHAEAQIVVIDTPGADTAVSRSAHAQADLVITPLNDSFVDFDMLGHVDPVTLDLTQPSLYAESVWEARKARMLSERKSLDWLVLRNRLATTEARNRKRLDERIEALAKRVGFRIGPGLRDRVIYRELFPFGLTVADLSSSVRPVAVSLSHLAARQELRAILQAAGLDQSAPTAAAALPAREADAA